MDFNDYVSRGIAFFQEGKLNEAIEFLKEAQKLQPDNADIRNFIMMAEEQASLFAKANNALAEEAKQRASVLGITDVEQAIAEYTEAIKSNPNDASVKSSLASIYYIRGLESQAKGNHARSIEDYSEAIKFNPDYPLAFNKRGGANLEVGNYDQAISDFEKVIQFNQNDAQAKRNLANAYNKRAIAYDKKGDYARAIQDFEKVLEFKPDDNTTRELLEMAKAELAKAK